MNSADRVIDSISIEGEGRRRMKMNLLQCDDDRSNSSPSF